MLSDHAADSHLVSEPELSGLTRSLVCILSPVWIRQGPLLLLSVLFFPIYFFSYRRSGDRASTAGAESVIDIYAYTDNKTDSSRKDT